jgi:tyrocidine synthetase III
MLFQSSLIQNTTAHQLFEQMAAIFPDHTALVFEDNSLTYAQVNQQANQLAHCLLASGIGSDSLVGICMHRSPELIVSILAVWKAGAAYLPLDPDYPQDRLSFMIQDAGLKLILSRMDSLSDKSPLEDFSGKILLWEEFLGHSFLFSDQNPNLQTSLSDLAYVIYTSGSTGKPKGVLLEHRGLANLIPAQTQRFGVTPESRFLQFASISFDTSLWEILLPLTSGATLVLAKAEQLLLDLPLAHTLKAFRITHFTAPPSVLALLNPSDFPDLQVVVSGGEALRKEIALRWAKACTLFNAYGPTEATIEVSASLIQPNSDRIAIGKPLPNTKFYILDQQGQQLPIGIPGELHVSGDGLARGYLNRPELTAEKFVTNPFAPGDRMYRTGDLARWLPNGEVEHLGRIDQQVKLRGFRIELGEVESALLAFSDLKDTVVSVRQNANGEDFLCAYYICDQEKPTEELRAFLALNLPGYMIPARFIHLNQFPLTPNGKVDRKALPDPGNMISTGAEFVAPATELEHSIARLWAQILGLSLDSISARDSFFALGGDSLKSAQLAGRLSQETQTAVSVKDIFSQPTIAGLSLLIGSREKTLSSRIQKAPVQDSYPLASAQKRVYLHSLRQGEDSTLYNMPAVYEVEGSLNHALLEKAFQQIVDSYDSFRVSFGLVDGELRQQVADKVLVHIPVHSLSENTLEESLKNWGTIPFDLEQAPLIRMELWQTPSRQILLIDTHHIVMDGMSYGPFFEALSSAYAGKELSTDSLSFIDYAFWQQSEDQQSARISQAEFWNQMFADGIPALELPADSGEPSARTHVGGTHSFRLEGEVWEKVQALCLQTGTTPYIFLYSAFTLLISKYAQAQDLVIATTSAGRNLPQTEDMVGMFVNTLAIRNRLESAQSFGDFLENTKQLLLSAFENDAYPYDELVSSLRSKGHSESLVRVMFTLLKESEEKPSLGSCKLNAMSFGADSSAMFDLTLSGTEYQHRIDFELEFDTLLFSNDSIRLLADRFLHLLQSAVASPDLQLDRLSILLNRETQQMTDWNSTASSGNDSAAHQLFEQMDARFPNHTALVFEDKSLTYAQVNQQANQLAHCLLASGIGSDSLVGICMHRSPELIVSILAVWKAGAAYLPLDPVYPQDRLSFMMQDAGVSIILSHLNVQSDQSPIEHFSGKVLLWEEFLGHSFLFSDQNPNLQTSLSDLAYLIYTSGSTGKPKGVLLEHRGLANLIPAQTQRFGVTPESRFLQFASLSFDTSLWEILLPLTSGATLVLAKTEQLLLDLPLAHALKAFRITHFTAPPSVLALLNPSDFPDLQVVVSGGEALRKEIALRWAKACTLFNAYGPTEATIEVSTSLIQYNADRIAIGKPLPNTKFYILDQQGQQLPIGIPGELHVSGDGLARGYLNRPELTAEKFVPNPFSPGDRMYRTGDLARWLTNGEVEHLGRIDQQVKIRGFRIELGEIESSLLAYPTIKDAVVSVLQGPDGADFLCAFYVAQQELPMAELRNFLAKDLPAYMIPARFMHLSQLPLTPNGKVDRKALPDPGETVTTGAEFVAPESELEKSIARLWAQLLGLNVDSISTRDSFFALGGDSLKSAQLAGRISQETQTAVSVKDIFSQPTIAGLSQLIDSREKTLSSRIQKAPVQDSYPLASAQKRVYLHSLRQGSDSTLYNMPAVYEVEGSLDHALLEKAFQHVVDSYDSFRVSFGLVDGELRQQVANKVVVHIPVHSLSEEALEESLKNWGTQPFDLEQAPLIRMELWKTPSRQLLAIDTHHIVMDGLSYEPFFEALSSAYAGQTFTVPSVQYIDYACWQQSEPQQARREAQAAFWNQMFADGIPALELPADFSETALRTHLGRILSFRLEGEVWEKVQALCLQTGTTPYIFLYSAFTLLISKYAQAQDLVIATTSAGRNLPETEDMVGMFVNTLAIRNTVDQHESFVRFLDRTKQLLLSAFENDAYPYDELIAKLRSKGHQENAVRVMFTMLKENEGILSLGDSELRLTELEVESDVKFDLTLSGIENQDQIDFDMVYAAELFSEETISLLAERFLNVLLHAVKAAENPVATIPILLEKEEKQIISWNSNIIDVPQTALVHQLVEAKVLEYPENTALVFEQEELSYSELNQKANRLAHYLRSCGIGAERRVGICLERSSELIISILAVWKSGGAYVPLDPSYPVDRLAYMIEDSGLELILTQNSLFSLLKEVCLGLPVHLVGKENLEMDMADYPQTNPAPACHSQDLAYIIYTSGTTGKPKGAMIEHRNAVNLAIGQHELININPSDRVLQFASTSFDASVWEILIALTIGAALVASRRENIMPGVALRETLNHQRITVTMLTPTALNHMDPDQVPLLHTVLSAGEALPLSIAQKWAGSTTLINAYGPTEVTVLTTRGEIKDGVDRIVLGRPLPNYKTYILDAQGNQLPIGIPGELCIGGASVGRGYLNKPELTAEKFVADPFNPGGKMYRSGDLARWLPSGEIEYFGRIDQQVKIRGFRIELGEIESALLSQSDIREAAVIVREDRQGDKYLCAYYVSETEKTVEALRSFLARTLPDFMVPARFVAMEKLPLSPSGKIDRKALPDPGETVTTGAEFVAPESELEHSITRLWAQLLGLNVDSISTRDSFFALGGDSLKSAQLAGRLSQETQTAVSVKDIFSQPTIAGLSLLIGSREKTLSSRIQKAPVQDSYPLASAQKRVYLHSLRQGEDSTLYNMPAVYEVEGSLNHALLEKAFQQIVDSYDSFRVSFGLVDGELRQQVADKVLVHIPVHSLSENTLEESLKNWGTIPFDLEQAPLIRMELWQTPSRQILLIDTHHIVMDGMSYGPFFEALSSAYAGKELSTDSLSFIDYAFWQQSEDQQSARISQAEFWNQMFADGIPALELPADSGEPSARTHVGGTHSFRLEGEVWEKVQALCLQTGTTPYIFLYSAFTLLISKYAQAQDLVIATTSAGRNLPQTEDMVGMFVNTLAIRNRLESAQSFGDFLENTKQLLLTAFENDAYPYDELVSSLRAKGYQENPVRAMFTMLKESEENLSLGSCKLNAMPLGGDTPAKFDLTLSGTEHQHRIDFDLLYAAELFGGENMCLLAERFVQLLDHICASPEAFLSDLPILLEQEAAQIRSWNSNIIDVPKTALVHQLVEAKVLEYPENTALVFEQEALSYAELNQKANRLAHYLISCSIGAERRVGICLERSSELIISILAVWKSGGAYVPLDPSYPVDRLAYMIEDSGLELILTQNSLLPLLEEVCLGLTVQLESKEELEEKLGDYDASNPSAPNTPDGLAYMIYTSGTTGKPKGVMLEHRNAVNLAFAQQHSLQVKPTDRVLQFASSSFDASVFEILLALATGAELVIASKEDLLPGSTLKGTINRKGITMAVLTPIVLNHMDPQQVPLLHTVLSAGESLPLSTAQKWSTSKNLINAYGPTEVTVCTTMGKVQAGSDLITIGRILPNYKTYVLDSDGNQLPIGVPGELYIGGAGVGRGYWNRPELTAEKFVADPFNPGGKMYRSGDLARWLPSGEIEYLGRIDQQVKIRGFRIELGEIESALLSQSDIREAAVTVREDRQGDKYLCAYYVSEKEKTVEALRSFLARTLPDFMVPARFVAMEKLPLSPSGKIDRKALPDPGNMISTGAEFVAPASELEHSIARLWAQLLGLNLDSISTRDSFFALGGDSLKSAQLAGRLSQETQTAVSVKDIFSQPTIAGLSQLIDSREKTLSSRIQKAPLQDSYPLASAQKRVYLHSLRQGEDSTLYNMPAVYEVDVYLDHALLENAFQQVVDSFDSFRVSFGLVDGELRQQVADKVVVHIPVHRLSEDTLDESLKNWGTIPFDLELAPLIRMELWQTPSRQILLIDTHHIVMDGMSYGPFFEALSSAYAGKELSSDSLSFIDYAFWQQSEAQQSARISQAEFWNHMFADGIPALELPAESGEPALGNHAGSTHSFRLEGEVWEKIQALCLQTGTTPYIFLYSAFTLLISKYAQTEDLVIATTSAGRNLPQTEDMVGMFVNTLAIRNRLESAQSFGNFLEDTKQLLLTAFENDAYPYDELVSSLRAKGYQENPVRAMFTMLKESEENLSLGSCKLSAMPLGGETPAKFDLTLSGNEHQHRIDFDLLYDAELFGGESMNLLAERFVHLLDHICTSPEASLSDLPILLEQEATQIISWNSNIIDVPQTALVHQLVEAKVLEYPENTALVFEQEELSYSELNQKANRLAHYLRSCGIGAERRVGICLERSSELIISILAVWKSGGAYVPLDPSYPVDRLAYMIEDSGLELILTQNSLLPLLEEVCLGLTVQLESKEELEEKLGDYAGSNLSASNTPDGLAYMIYTSGTTGKPKGVMLEHRNAVNLAFAQQHSLQVKPSDRVLQFASSSFDASVWEILIALTNGAAIVCVSKEKLMPGAALTDTINRGRITVTLLSPTALSHLVPEQVPSLHTVLSGGEALPLSLSQKWAKCVNLFNAYGPTEITVIAAMGHVGKDTERITIGSPLPNYKTYILDAQGNQLPIGIPGELCIGGAGVGRGYLNQPDLTAEKFVADPFNPGGKMYRSGDLARWLPNGEIEYLGRIDQQVKIRGFRIELGEIESALLSQSDIREAAVTVREDRQGDKYLCAYYVSETEKTVEALRSFLARTLPDFMVPARFVAMEKLPLSPSGKIDRKALPDPGETVTTGAVFVAPATELEKSIARLWAQLLGLSVDSISTRDSFFALGGDSLKSAQLAGRLSQETQTAVSVKDIFSNPTIEGLSQLIAKKEKNALSVIVKAPLQDSYPLASAQKRVYLHSLRQGEDSTLYNMPAVYEVDVYLDHALLENAFQQVVDSFDSFRVSFGLVDGELRQQVADKVVVHIPVHRLSEDALDESLKNWGTIPFDLELAPLIRMELWQTPSRQILLIDTHHIVMDGMSYGPFFESLSKAYAGQELSVPSIQYTDYAYWQQAEAHQARIALQGAYWRKIYAQSIPSLELPYDFPTPATRTHSGGLYAFKLSLSTTEAVQQLADQTGTTPFMVLYSAFALLVGKYAGQSELVIGTTSSGRNLPELEDMVGMLVNTLAIRTDLPEDSSFIAYLESNKKVLLESFENESYPYEDLVADLRQKEKFKTPVRAMFTMMPQGVKMTSIDSLKLSPLDTGAELQSKFDLTFSGVEGDESIDFSIIYPTELFHPDTISLLASRYEHLLLQAFESPDKLLRDLSIQMDQEKGMISAWNDTRQEFPSGQTLSELIEATASLFPANIALAYQDRELTYKEFDSEANQLAQVLMDRGIKRGDLVGLLMKRSPELIVSILAVWKAGAAYVPLDPSYPIDRLHYMLEDAGAGLLLTHEAAITVAEKASEGLPTRILMLENLASELKAFSSSKLPCPSCDSDLAYIIYTSGSTGKPKGVMVEHRTAVNLAFAFKESMALVAVPRILQFASISFDASVTDLLMAFANGGTLVIADRENLLPGPVLTETLNRYQISHIKLTPTALGYLSPDDLPYLYTVYAGGEALSLELARRWASKKRLINAYGPTEATVNTSLQPIQSDVKRVVLGRPLPNYQIHILDQHGDPLPIGLAGELCIGGAGLARGYLNRPELTAEKFISDPNGLGGRLYRSGDLARWLSNGEVEFLGRIDHQVKIRGFRIECGEIESALLAIKGVSTTAVIARSDSQGEKYLCAYFVAEEKKTVNELRYSLSQSLPEFMVPARFVQLDRLPTNGSGKVDRKALPAPEEDYKTGRSFVAPQSAQEKTMIEAWSATLSISPEVISMEDDFFALGGNSLKAVMLISKIQQRIGVQIPVHIVFQNPTPKSLIDHIDHTQPKNPESDSHLIPLQPIGWNAPLFLVPGIEGKCYYLTDLAKALGKDQPVYGFQYVGLMNGERPFETVEEIAAFNISLMKRVQAQGPYQLAGHSMGGWVAVEMANQLLQQGEKISFIGLLDSYSPQVLADLGGFSLHSTERDIHDLIMLVERLVAYYSPDLDFHGLKEELEQTDPKERLSLVKDWTVLKGLIPSTFSQEELGQWAKLIGTNSRISFAPRKINQITHLFKAESSNRVDQPIAECHGWSTVVNSNLIIQSTPGNHFTMTHFPQVQTLANAIQKCIQKPTLSTPKNGIVNSKRALESLTSSL